MYFNYGCIPRTWEGEENTNLDFFGNKYFFPSSDPNELDPAAGHPGDNDPLDVCEIGLRMMKVAEISSVKVLGVLCLIDEGTMS